jgi:hypothetical protein
MNKIKQTVQVLTEVCEHYDKEPEKREKLKSQIEYLLANLDNQIKKENAAQ